MSQNNTQVVERTKLRIDKPKLFAVIFHNDDFTTMEFVVDVLRSIFFKSTQEAFDIMLKVHHEGRGTAGIYPLDIARSKSVKAINRARTEGFPLQITLEEVTDQFV